MMRWINSDVSFQSSKYKLKHYERNSAVSGYFSEKSFQDVSRAYEAIRPKAVAEYLGLTEGLENENEPSPKLVDLLVAKGWSWDAETKLFHPKVPVKPVADTENLKSDGMSKVLELIGTYGD